MKKSLFYMLPVILMAMTGSCASESSTDDNQSTQPAQSVGRKLRTLTITQNGDTRSTVGTTRSILIDKGEEGIYASWEMGDELTVYNKSNFTDYETVKATSSTKRSTFSGEVDCDVNDVLRLFYPAVGTEGSVTGTNGNLTLDISGQKGTLDDIQMNYDFNYGEATVTAVTDNTATADAGKTDNLMAICKFTFKCDKEYLKDITKVSISGVPATATYTLNANNTPALTPGEATTIDITADHVDKNIYIALFPGETIPTFTLTTSDKVYEGSLSASTLAAGKFYDVVVETTCTGDNTETSSDYIEVCGIKWAKGNLQYDPVNGGDEGFQENWRIAPAQWHWIGYEQIPDNFTNGVTNVTINLSSESRRDDYYIGELSSCFRYHELTFNDSYSGKLYYDRIDPNYVLPLNQFHQATHGDLAYYVSNGIYRMPSRIEMLLLIEKASNQYGYYISNSKKIYGYLFTTPEDERTTNSVAKEITEEDLEKGLFLPATGDFYQNSRTRSLPKLHGYYAYAHNRDYLEFRYSTSQDIGLRGRDGDYSYTLRIRPVLCE